MLHSGQSRVMEEGDPTWMARVSNWYRTWKALKAIKDEEELLLSPSVLVYKQKRPEFPVCPPRAESSTKAKRPDTGNDTDIVCVIKPLQTKSIISSDFDQQSWGSVASNSLCACSPMESPTPLSNLIKSLQRLYESQEGIIYVMTPRRGRYCDVWGTAK